MTRAADLRRLRRTVVKAREAVRAAYGLTEGVTDAEAVCEPLFRAMFSLHAGHRSDGQPNPGDPNILDHLDRLIADSKENA